MIETNLDRRYYNLNKSIHQWTLGGSANDYDQTTLLQIMDLINSFSYFQQKKSFQNNDGASQLEDFEF